MHSNDVMTKNTLKFLNKSNKLSVKMAVDTKDDFLVLMKRAIDKVGKSLGYNEVTKLQ